MRRVGVLVISGQDVEINEKPSVYDAMYSFLLSRVYALEWGDFYKPRYLVQLDEDGLWRKLRPTAEDLKACHRATNAWMQQQELEKRYRE